jgi:hypothetical protein
VYHFVFFMFGPDWSEGCPSSSLSSPPPLALASWRVHAIARRCERLDRARDDR